MSAANPDDELITHYTNEKGEAQGSLFREHPAFDLWADRRRHRQGVR